MASIVPGFEYDIFISYRQNDNRSGWVTEFVQHLNEELAATIKEPVSVYFDNNPHDGILETHSVDKSLEGKLRCFIFIPILSQTYCDAKSFAWQHEFCVFNKLAKEDGVGTDIKLSNGNVASRILPIKIHDLDPEDKGAIEKEIGGALRAIEFIYKEPGVNRPLKIFDNKPDNRNKTDYSNQVNKVANAIKEMMNALKGANAAPSNNTKQKPAFADKTMRTSALIAVVLVLIVAGIYFYWPKKGTVNQGDTFDKSIAVLAFKDMSPNNDQEWLSEGMSAEILNSLARVKKLKVMSRTSSFYFKDKAFTIGEIGEKLNVAHVVEGSVIKLGDQIRITAQLTRVKDGSQVWSQQYNRPTDDMFKVLTDIAENVAQKLLTELSKSDVESIAASDETSSPEAFEHFIKGIWYYIKWDATLDSLDYVGAEREFIQAIKTDSRYASAHAYLGLLYNEHGEVDKNKKVKSDSLLRLSFRLNPKAMMVQRAMAFYYFNVRSKPLLDSAFYFLRLIYPSYADDPLVNKAIYQFYDKVGLPDLAERFARNAVDQDPYSTLHRSNLGAYESFLGKSDAKTTIERAVELDSSNGHAVYYLCLMALERLDKIEFQKLARKFHPGADGVRHIRTLQGFNLAFSGNEREALNLEKSAFNKFYVYFILNDKENMILMLAKAVEEDQSISYLELRSKKLFNPIREAKGFQRILEALQQRDQSMRKKYGSLD